MFYIEENDKPTLIEKILIKPKVARNKIIIPIEKDEITDKRQEKLARRVLKLLKKSNSKKIVLSKQINKLEGFKKFLERQNYIIVKGKWLYKMLVPEIMEYILKRENWKKAE